MTNRQKEAYKAMEWLLGEQRGYWTIDAQEQYVDIYTDKGDGMVFDGGSMDRLIAKYHKSKGVV